MLFAAITYEVLDESLQRFGWPRLNSAGMAQLFTSLASLRGNVSGLGSGQHALRFKTTALYYISAFSNDPPSYDEHGKPIEQTKVGSLRFQSEESRDLALIVALGKLALLWWAATGDDFDVTASGLASTPVNPISLPSGTKQQLVKLAARAQEVMLDNVIYTKYAGKWMGNFDVKFARNETDTSDKCIIEALGLGQHWEDVELAYDHFMKVTGERPGTVRGALDFSS